jgi:hypothetical protein
MLYVKILILRDETFHLIEYSGFLKPESTELPRSAVRHVVMNDKEDSSGPTNWVLVQQAADELELFRSTDREESQWVQRLITQWARR